MSSQAYFHLPLATKSVTFSKSSLWQQLFTQSTHLGQTRGSCPQRAFSGGLSTGASLFTCSSFCFPWQCSEQGTCPFSSNISSALLSTLPSVFSSRYPSPVTLHSFIYVTFIVSLSITRSCIIYLFVQLPCCNEHTQETETLGFGLCFCCCLWLRAQNSAWHIIGTWMEDGWMDRWMGGWTDRWIGGWMSGWAGELGLKCSLWLLIQSDCLVLIAGILPSCSPSHCPTMAVTLPDKNVLPWTWKPALSFYQKGFQNYEGQGSAPCYCWWFGAIPGEGH